ncbi:MAG: ABC transporter permease [Candidatus Eiseniibacteriota bacterium]
MKHPAAAERVRELVRKEFLQLKRDHRLRVMIIVAPVIQLLVFGYAVSTDVRNTALFVVDHDGTRTSRELVESFTAAGYFRLVGRSERSGDLVRALNGGRAVVGLEIPAGFARDLRGGGGAKVQLLVDGTNSNVATVAKGYGERIVQAFAVRSAGGNVPAVVDLRDRAWYNPALESRNYNVPAVVGALVLLVCLLLTSLAVVREREIGTLEQLMVSPVRPAELIAGKAIPFAIIGLIDLVLVTTVAILWFDIPFRGNFAVLLLASVLYLMSALGVGLLVSTVSATQQEAFMSSFLVFMPTILLSGFMFPVTSMPPAFQAVTLINPMRHYLEIVRAVFMKGVGLEVLWPQFATLTVIGGTILTLAAGRFRKRVS